MRIAILETIVMPAGHEVEFDRILVEELKKQGHDPVFFVPENYPFKIDYHVPVEYLSGGEAVSYAGAGKLKKIYLSAMREMRRIAWLDDACGKAARGSCDAIIVPTNSWRVMRSVRRSEIKNSPVPVLFMFHGIMPKDRSRFVENVKKLKRYSNIHLGALGLQTAFPELADCPNFHVLPAPVYKPLDMKVVPDFHFHDPLRLGFFGQYRKEKNLDFLLQAFIQARFSKEVEFTVQGATVTQEDSDDFERLALKYKKYGNIRFLHKNLLGIEWQKALMDTDIILMPYGAERYRYQPSAMLFTAIGYFKPVLQSPEMNPELLAEFKIGKAVNLDSVDSFSGQLEDFVNRFQEEAEEYRNGLIGANRKYGQDSLIRRIIEIFMRMPQKKMRVAILESIVMPAGHEVEFDRILVDELRRQGHEPVFFVPENFPFKFDYKADIEYLQGGEAISYAGVDRLRKLFLSALREKRRRAWFTSACEKARSGCCDAIIVPTATYRYLKALRDSELKNSPVPVYFIFHGVNPKEQSEFEKQARLTEEFPQIRLKVITLRDDLTGRKLKNVDLLEPVVYKPMDLPVNKELDFVPPVKLGFFGQFRQEKNLEILLKAFVKARFLVPVKLIVQGSTVKPADTDLFEHLAKEYDRYSSIEFWHKNLIGEEWQKALLGVDAIIMPYAAERYRYHWSAMLFTAIGFYKPVLSSPDLNPEVLEKYKIGMAVDLTSVDAFAKQLEQFVADLVENAGTYRRNLDKANEEYSHERLVKNILRN